MKTIKYIFQFMIICLLVVNMYNCSFITKVAVMEPSNPSKDTDCKTCFNYHYFNLTTKAGEYNDDTLSIIFCTAFKPGRVFLWGPLYVPVIPNPFVILNYLYPSHRGFYVNMKMKSNSYFIPLDLNKFMFYDEHDSLLKANVIWDLEERDMGALRWDLHFMKKTKETSIYLSIFPRYYSFHFNKRNLKVKELTIKYNTGEKTITLIKFKKKNKLIYNPLFSGID